MEQEQQVNNLHESRVGEGSEHSNSPGRSMPPVDPTQLTMAQGVQNSPQVTQLMALQRTANQGQAVRQLTALPAGQGNAAVMQRFKFESEEGEFESVGDMDHLTALETQVKKEHLQGKFRAETLDEYHNATIGTAFDTALATQVTATNEKLKDNTKLQDQLYHYMKVYSSGISFEQDLRIYNNLSVAAKGKVDAPLIKQGVANFAAVATNVRGAMTQLSDYVRASLATMLEHGGTYDIDGVLSGAKRAMDTAVRPLYMVPSGVDHNAMYFLKNSGGRDSRVPGEQHDKSDDAIWEELIELKTGVSATLATNAAFKPAILDIAKANSFANGPHSSASFAEPTPTLRAPLVNLQHTTKVGTHGYKGRSVWGKIASGKVEVHALAQHGATNKHYRLVSGTTNVPGNWRMNN